MKEKKQSLLIVLIATFLLSLAAQATPAMADFSIDEILMCHDVDTDSLEPKGVGPVYLNYSLEAVIWVNMTDPPESVTFKWYKPDGSYYTNTESTVHEPSGKSWGVTYSSIKIDGETPANELGKWLVETYVGGEHKADNNFVIIDYVQISERISSQQQQIEEIQHEISDLLADYNQLVEDYASLTSDYQDLQEDKATLESDLEAIQEAYNEQKEDYSNLQGSLSSSRNMMYGSLAVAVASVAVAAYFGAVKK